MKRLNPRITVIAGASVGLIAGVTAYGASVSAPAPVAYKPARVSLTSAPVRPAPARPAPCTAGQKLENGVCIVHVRHIRHVVHTVVVPAPAPAPAPAPVNSAASSPSNQASSGSGRRSSYSGQRSSKSPQRRSSAPATTPARRTENAAQDGREPAEQHDD